MANTLRHYAFDSFLFHVIFLVMLHFKINILIPNLFSCRKTIPRSRSSFKTKTETLGIKTKTKTLVFKTKTKTFKLRSRDISRLDPSLVYSTSGKELIYMASCGKTARVKMV